MRAYAPGYCADGRYAVLALGISWSMHRTDATYLLARVGAGWRVVFRQLVYYF